MTIPIIRPIMTMKRKPALIVMAAFPRKRIVPFMELEISNFPCTCMEEHPEKLIRLFRV